MGLMSEYISRQLSAQELEDELLQLICKYNELRETFLFVYAGAIGKPIPDISLSMDDYYIIFDILRNNQAKKLDFYIETPGGSGEATEEVVRFLRSKFEHVTFVISGEAKSAGTIMAMSGDEIMMTQSGSLGPIDAQMRIGRTIFSAYDYVNWVQEKRTEAAEKGRLNPFDATMVAQITPGELRKVNHALNFAKERVIEWLPKYKFKNWTTTQTRQQPVTSIMREKRATEIADDLTNNSKWRSHGRSIKIDDIKELLDIKRVDDDEKLSDIVYRIQIVIRLLFGSTTSYKVFATCEEKLFKKAIEREAVQIASQQIPHSQIPEVVTIEVKCNNCGKTHKLYGKFLLNPAMDADLLSKGFVPFPNNNRLKCDKCNFETDLAGAKNDIETKVGRKLIM